ncbi:MAG: lysylphosphatidylglycerol synthase transmembrane domain-containing protein [Candidatus Diapherotrites archaeon]|nr:lysylphosphatidylglycerol synthase transmembrane domain-containing protein [Candidatus Diapherotrites archaeon]MDZ4256125.1 lysylphosphatidylglycerol synthase transmembrane domain-containing protein [archaeon]
MKWSWLSFLVTLAILYLAATRLDWVSLWDALFLIDLSLVAMGMLFWVFLMICKGLKWKTLVGALGGKIGMWDSMKVLWIGLFVSVITPGRLGDFVRAAYVKKDLSTGGGIMAVVVDRMMDVLTLLLFATLGLLFLSQEKGINLLSPPLILGFIIGAFVGAYLMLNRRFARRIFPLFMRILPPTYAQMLQKYGRQFFDSLPALKKNTNAIFLTLLASTGAWIGSIFFGWFLLQSFGFAVPLEVALLVVPIMSLVEIIPIGVAGLGTRELAVVIVLGAYGIPPEPAVLFSLLYFTLGYIPSFLIGAWAFNTHPIPIEGGLKGLIAKYRSPRG